MSQPPTPGAEASAYQVVRLPRVLTAEQATELVGHKVPEREPDLRHATVAADADTGQPVFAYLPLGDVAALRRAVLRMPFTGETLRADGTSNVSRTFGYRPRRPHLGREGCGHTRLWAEAPDEHSVVLAWAEHLQTMLAEVFPEQHRADRATIAGSGVLPEWRLGETTWTSGVINKSSALPYHRDAFNFRVWTAMPVLRRHMRGGYLHIPEYDVTVESRDGWAVFFPGWELVHGVTPMRPIKPGGYRYSVVYYALRGMKSCFEHAVETEYALRARTERERGIAAKLAERKATDDA